MPSLHLNVITLCECIQIYDGDSINATMTHEICGGPHPPPIVSSGNALTLSLTGIQSDEISSYHFEARYSVVDNCKYIDDIKTKVGHVTITIYDSMWKWNAYFQTRADCIASISKNLSSQY